MARTKQTARKTMVNTVGRGKGGRGMSGRGKVGTKRTTSLVGSKVEQHS
jgi:hypothetical protein